jgi:hypothetical protein
MKLSAYHGISFAGANMGDYEALHCGEQTKYWINRFVNQIEEHREKFGGNGHRDKLPIMRCPGRCCGVIPAV